MPELVLLRHGQSNGTPTTFHRVARRRPHRPGRKEAARPDGCWRPKPDLDLRVLHTSLLTRAIRTAEISLAEAGWSWMPVRRHWRLNERHYGALQGLDKKETTADTGRPRSRSGAGATPPRRRRSSRAPTRPGRRPPLPRLPVDAPPTTECLADVVARVLPYWEDAIVPDLLAEGPRGGAVLVVAHGNSLRALRKHIDGIDDDQIVGLEIPTGIPFRYRLADDLTVVSSGYLGDPEAARAAAEAVARQAG